jgi:hypothetical protein
VNQEEIKLCIPHFDVQVFPGKDRTYIESTERREV